MRCVQFDGTRVVSGSYDHTLRIWDVATGATLHTLVGHTQKIYSMEFDGEVVIRCEMRSHLIPSVCVC